MVGAGSVVTKDVPPGTVVAGNPARIICSIDELDEHAIKKSIPIEFNDRLWSQEIIDWMWERHDRKQSRESQESCEERDGQ